MLKNKINTLLDKKNDLTITHSNIPQNKTNSNNSNNNKTGAGTGIFNQNTLSTPISQLQNHKFNSKPNSKPNSTLNTNTYNNNLDLDNLNNLNYNCF